mgnify:CR=1 FL=1
MSLDRPYCACATPPGMSGIAVIRLAGGGAAAVVDRVFTLLRSAGNATSLSEMSAYTAAFGHIYDPKTSAHIDDVICTVFLAPHSYTGEDTIEISCHGGAAARQEILRVLYENGARPAEPGEFTRQAFLSGKLDLSQAEAVMDVISADSKLALEAAESQLNGALRSRISAISSHIYRCFASLEMIVEFPEHEDTPENTAHVSSELLVQLEALRDLSVTYNQGKLLRERMTVVLCGVPNSGKSSLLNSLAGYDRAIVTATAGTTRDTLEVFTVISGLPIRIIDTAGIRETKDEIELMGVSRAYQAMQEADLILWLFSPDTDTPDEERDLFSEMSMYCQNTETGILLSKSDLVDDAESDRYGLLLQQRLQESGSLSQIRFVESFSSVTGKGIDAIAGQIIRFYEEKGQGKSSQILITNARHFDRIMLASSILSETIELLNRGESADIACSLLRSACEALGEITGETVSEELVETIFSRFCIGK